MVVGGAAQVLLVALLVALLAACRANATDGAPTPDPLPPDGTVGAAGTSSTSTTTVEIDPTTTAVASTTTVGVATSTIAARAATAVTFPTGRPLRVLVVGDSVAASLAGDDPRQRIAVAGRGIVEVANVGSVACPVVLDGSWWFTDGSTLPKNPTCDRPERYDDEVAGFAPDVVLAIFGWPGVGGGHRFPDGTIAVPCDAGFDTAWEAGYRSLIARLEPYTTVVATTVSPVALDARRAETRCLNDIVRRLPAPVLDLQGWLCPDLDCSARAELRTDGVHFADAPSLRTQAMTEILALLTAPGG